MTAALLAFRHPGLRVTTVDRVELRAQPHFAEAGVDRVQYRQLDVLDEVFVPEMQALAKDAMADGRPSAVLGMHLCGRLSERAIEAFYDVCDIRACILAPCCLPSAQD